MILTRNILAHEFIDYRHTEQVMVGFIFLCFVLRTFNLYKEI
jgi:hypothetical protein